MATPRSLPLATHFMAIGVGPLILLELVTRSEWLVTP